MPTSVVTGGAGFLGSHLSDALLERGHRVLCVDNLDTGSLTNIDHLRRDDFVFVQHDLVSHIEIAERIDFVFHLASPASPIDYLRLPLHTLKVGAYGTHNALGLAKRHRARFLLASTSEVYGDPLVHPQPESYWGNVNPIGPRGVYDEAKRYAEAMTMAYHRQQGVDTAIARIFNTYGPRMLENDGRVVSNFIVQALRGEPITIYGGGTQTRSFCFVDDLVRGLQLLMESPSSVTGPCNLGNPHEVTIEAIARDVLAYTESASPLRFEELPKDDPKRRKPVIDTAVKVLGWRPRVALKDGLRATIAYFAMRIAGQAPTLVPAAAPRRSGRTAARGRLTIADQG
jgi:UDP-glucuronate decarboxylase